MLKLRMACVMVKMWRSRNVGIWRNKMHEDRQNIWMKKLSDRVEKSDM
jgi:hypothetical protein